MEEWKCYYCEKELKEKEECTCEKSKNKKGYVTVNAVKSDNGYTCSCGNKNFKQIGHMDFTNFYSSTYKCTECGNCIGLQFNRSNSWD